MVERPSFGLAFLLPDVVGALGDFIFGCLGMSILLRRHLEKPRIRFVELALMDLPSDHEFQNGFSGCLYLRLNLFDRLTTDNISVLSC
jgi:hypothetical protein